MTHPTPLILLPDTNVLIHARALATLPWEELGRDPVEIVLCGPVVREIDALKTRPGRDGREARAVSSRIRSLMKAADRSEVVRERDPRVVLRLAPANPNAPAAREGLDTSHGDQAIINYAITRMDEGADVLFLTNDNIAAMTAEGFGLPAMLLPDEWLRPPEPDEAARELARRDAEVARLRAAEPKIELSFVDGEGAAIERLETTMHRHLPVPGPDVDRLVARVAALAPKVQVDIAPATSIVQAGRTRPGVDLATLAGLGPTGTTPVTERDIDRYSEAHAAWLGVIRDRIEELQEECNRRRKWPEATLVATNAGTRPAQDVLVEIEGSGRFWLSGPPDRDDDGDDASNELTGLEMPPRPPRPLPRVSGSIGQMRVVDDRMDLLRGLAPHVPPKRADDSFYWRRGRREPTRTMALECRTWRHGRGNEDFAFRVSAGDDAEIAGLIVGRVSATNLTDPVKKSLPLRIAFRDEETLTLAEQLVDDLEARIIARGERG